MRKRGIWQFLAATVVLAILGFVLVDVSLRSLFDADSSKKRCARMIAILEKVTDSESLRANAKALVDKYPTGPAHDLGTDEQPQQVKRVMEALGLGVATVADDGFGHRGLCLSAPGGFGSYGVKVVPAGAPLTFSIKGSSQTEFRWKDGITVFYAH